MSQNTKKPVEAIILPVSVVNGILEYLGKRPFAEVTQLITAIQSHGIGTTEQELVDAGFLSAPQETSESAVKEVVEPSNVKHIVEK